MYDWRRLTIEERDEVLRERKLRRHPWHRPPHHSAEGESWYLLSAACYEHKPIIGVSASRLGDFESSLIEACQKFAGLEAWCVLPNHYHALLQTDALQPLRAELGRLHGRLSHTWNGEDASRGRTVWYSGSDRWIRSEGHFWTSMNYVHHNPVRHGYVDRWQEWPFSSALEFLERIGREQAAEIWRKYPIRDYGEGWDAP